MNTQNFGKFIIDTTKPRNEKLYAIIFSRGTILILFALTIVGAMLK